MVRPARVELATFWFVAKGPGRPFGYSSLTGLCKPYISSYIRPVGYTLKLTESNRFYPKKYNEGITSMKTNRFNFTRRSIVALALPKGKAVRYWDSTERGLGVLMQSGV
jgi:hypothetical protein